jgi:hypothetical protein
VLTFLLLPFLLLILLSTQDIQAILQSASEWADPIQVSQLLHLLNMLLHRNQQLVYRLIANVGSVPVIISILQRQSQHLCVQLSAMQLIGGMLRFGSASSIPSQHRIQTKGVFAALYACLLPHKFYEEAYRTFLELLLSMSPGSISGLFLPFSRFVVCPASHLVSS